jgi:hypothetical protein
MMRELPCFLIKPRPYSLEAMRLQIAFFTAWEHTWRASSKVAEPLSGSGTLAQKWSR